MAIGDTYLVTAKLCTPGGPISVSQAYKQTLGTNDVNTMQDLVDKVKVGWATKLMLALSTQTELDAIDAQPQSGVNEVPGWMNYTGVAGARLGQACPNAVAFIVSQLTDAPNSNANGRMFVPGVSEDDLLAGVWIEAVRVIMQTFADDLDDDITAVGTGAATFAAVVISRFFESLPRGVPIAFQILSSIAKIQPKQQRRRNSRRFGLS